MNGLVLGPIGRALCRKFGVDDVITALRMLVSQQLGPVLDAAIPTDLALVLDELGIYGPFYQPLKSAGFLVNDARDARILINEADSKGRQRFTIGHEVMHFLLQDYGGLGSDQSLSTKEEEYLCDFGSSLILVSDEVFDSVYGARPIAATRIKKLAERAAISLEAAIVTSCLRSPCAFLVAIWNRNPDGSMTLREAYRSASLASDFWLEPQYWLRSSHNLARYSFSRRDTGQYRDFSLTCGDRKIWMKSDAAPIGRRGGATLSVIHPKLGEKWKAATSLRRVCA